MPAPVAAVLLAPVLARAALAPIPASPLPTATDLVALGPVIVVAATALLVIVADWFMPDGEIRVPSALALFGLVGAAGLFVLGWPSEGMVAFTRVVTTPDGVPGTSGLLAHDAFGSWVGLVIVLAAAATLLLALDHLPRRGMARAEFVALVLFATAGMMLLAMASDLIVLFLCLETFSLALYVLAAFDRGERTSQEAAFKYFVLGSAAAGFLLYGIALVYAATGTTSLGAIGAVAMTWADHLPRMGVLGFALILVGLGFKIGMAPFHQWGPDVYQGAPTPVTAFMATATKAAAFAALLRVLWTAFPWLASTWQPALTALAVLTMVVGNLAALVQADLKRMLAYSAIAHAGYILVAVVVGTVAGRAAALFYLLVYAFMNMGAFGVLVVVRRSGATGADTVVLDDLKGFARHHGWLAAALTICLLGLTGLPPTAGFLGKWYIVQAAVGAGQVGLAVAMVLNGVLAAFYYLRPVLYMYVGEPGDDRRVRVPVPAAVVIAGTAAVTALAVLVASPVVERATTAAASMTGLMTKAGATGATLYLTAPDLERDKR
jgi:NADH-quinone oxidoreductase subunit N